MAIDEANEGCTLVITASFFDENGLAVTPTAGTYRIDDLISGEEILDDTALPSLGTEVDVEITPEQMPIINPSRPYETHILTVEFDYGAGKHGNDEYRFHVKNLLGVTPVTP